MAFLKNMRLKAGIYFLRRHAAKTVREKRVIGYENIKSIVLLFHSTEPKIPAGIDRLTQALSQDFKKVYQVIYYPGDLKNLQFGPHEKRVIVGSKEVNFLFLPNKQAIDSFKDISADYLLDLNIEDCFPLIYLAGLSDAKLKLGKHSDLRLPYFDVLINEETDNQLEFIQHMLHYLKILNPQSNE